MKMSHISSGQEFRTRLQNRKLGKILRKVTFTIVGTFMALQIVMMVLTVVTSLPIHAFLYQLWIFCFLIVIGLNSNQLFLYFKLSGRPYIKAKYYRNVKHFGWICALWNLGFIMKSIAAYLGATIYDIQDQDSFDLYSACLYAICDFFTMVIPFYSVIDRKFVKMFSFKILEADQVDVEVLI
jgi:hypothetical protein